jgi:hypothetical protein
MMAGCRFAYAQARLQARYSELPGDADWQRLSATRSLSGWLEEARSGALKDWVKGFSANSDSHDIERGLRAQFVDTVEQVARYLPALWRDAVLWCRWLPLLGLFDHLRSGAALPGWVSRDYRLASLVDGGGIDLAAARQAGIDVLLSGEGADLQWLDGWRQRWPRCRRDYLETVDALAVRCAAHLDAFRRSPPDKTWPLRRALRERLRLEFHLRLLQPAAVFIFLTLVALDLERLRRALLDRALFPAELSTELPVQADQPSRRAA